MQSKKSLIIIISLVLLLLLAGGAYWYFLMGPAVTAPPTDTTPGGFQPFGNTNTPGGTSNTGNNTQGTSSSSVLPSSNGALPTLRLLSSTPVGGYGVSTTPVTTMVRWVDRGRGNVYEAFLDSSSITTISNTIVPRIYESVWNRNLTAFTGSILQENSSSWMAVYSRLATQSGANAATTSSGQTSFTPFSLQGKKLPSAVVAYAASPKKDRLFMFTNESGTGAGYVSNFDGSGASRIFTTPLTEVTVSWPTDSVITVTTKGSAEYGGYMYFVNAKTGTWTKMLGPIMGLSTVTSHDGKYVLWSSAGNNGGINTGLYSVSAKASGQAGVTTLAEKCAWGNSSTAVLYCGVPTGLPSAVYPDDWYKGLSALTDRLWQIDTVTGTVKMLSSPLEDAGKAIDAINLDLDSRDSRLIFMNKNDLSLWSLDLTKKQ